MLHKLKSISGWEIPCWKLCKNNRTGIVETRALALVLTPCLSIFYEITLWRSRDGEVVRTLAFHQCDPGSSAAICGSSLSLVFALFQGFFSGFSGFPPSTKTNTPNSRSTRIGNPHENQLRLMWLPLLILSPLLQTHHHGINWEVSKTRPSNITLSEWKGDEEWETESLILALFPWKSLSSYF